MGKKRWIIDYRASDHMTGFINLFSLDIPSFGQLKVKITNGSLSPIVGFGTIKINSTLVLKSMLHVPYLSYSLLYMNKISKDCNC